jgi:SAM-dependent methyltransferase
MDPSSVLNKEFIFIIGSPRSGTTWLHAMLAEHPLICSTANVELTLFSRYVSAWTQAWRLEQDNIRNGRWTQGLPHLWGDGDFCAFLSLFLEKTYGPLLRARPEATHILDKQPDYSFHLADIDRLVPRFRLVHVIRDGRDTACSMVNARRELGFGARDIPQAAREWQRYCKAARQGRRFGDRYLEVRFEDLLTNGPETLLGIFRFCGLAMDVAEANRIVQANTLERMRSRRVARLGEDRGRAGLRRGRAGYWRETLTPVQRYAFHREAGSLLVALKYAGPGWWSFRPWQRLTLPLHFRLRESLWHRIRRAGAELLGYHLMQVLPARLKTWRKRLDSLWGEYTCPVCESRVKRFIPLPEFYRRNLTKHGLPYGLGSGETCNAEAYSCPFCLASDRERLYCLYLRDHLAQLRCRPRTRIMHFAPEPALRAFMERHLASDSAVTYTTADFSMPDVDLKLDLADLRPIANESLDFFICSHVLEHVPDDRRALSELYRVLRPSGTGILAVPICLAATEIDEDPTVTDEAERWRRFGQYDHVRLYSKRGFVERVANAGFHVRTLDAGHFGVDCFKKHGIHSGSVLYVVEKPGGSGAET